MELTIFLHSTFSSNDLNLKFSFSAVVVKSTKLYRFNMFKMFSVDIFALVLLGFIEHRFCCHPYLGSASKSANTRHNQGDFGRTQAG
jgi:hypothetical protein